MQRRGVAVVDGLAAGNSDGVGLDLDIEGRLADARQLGDQHDIVTLPKDVERRVGARGRPPKRRFFSWPPRTPCFSRVAAQRRARTPPPTPVASCLRSPP